MEIPAAVGSTKKAGITSQRPPKAKRSPQPLTAYNLYFRYERARLLATGKLSDDRSPVKTTSSDLRDFVAKNPYEAPASRKKRSHARTHGAITFTELSRMVSKNWRALDAECKEPFHEVAHELKVEHYRKLEEERKREKENKVVGLNCEASGKLTPKNNEQNSALPLTSTTRLVAKEQKNSKKQLLIKSKLTDGHEASPHIDTKYLRPTIVSTSETPPTKKPMVELEHLFSIPSPAVVSPPESPLGTFRSDSVSLTNSDGMMLGGSELIEPFDLNRNTSEASLVLEMDFADAWLTDTFHENETESTLDKKPEPKTESVGFHEVLGSASPPPSESLFSDEIEFIMGERDLDRMKWIA